MRALWLADVLRGAGLTVHEYTGWRTRGSSSWGPLRGVICHATAGSRSSTDAGETRVLWVTGSTSAPAPISQLYLSRSGQWWVGASGRCNHVLTGHKGPHRGHGNSRLLGIEAQNDNRGEPWSAVMLDSYQRGVAAICRHMGWPASVAVAHAEHQNGKTDPLGISMTTFRRAVADLIEGDDMPTVRDIFTTDGILETPDLAAGGGKRPDAYLRDNPHWHFATYIKATYENVARAVQAGRQARDGNAAILAAVAGQDVAQAAADAARAAVREELAGLGEELGGALLAELGPALVETLGDAAGELPAAVVEAAVARALARTSLTVQPAEEPA